MMASQERSNGDAGPRVGLIGAAIRARVAASDGRLFPVGPEVDLPSGTVTFLFTDVEGSTQLWVADQRGMSESLALHDTIIRKLVEGVGGYVFSTGGDSFAAAFARPSDALAAAQAVQAELQSAYWPGPALRVRIGLHLGEAEERGGDYFGPPVNTAARVAAAGHGGQVLLTEVVRVTSGVGATDLGVHHLRDVAEPLRLFQVGGGRFPPLRVVDPAMTNLPVRPTPLIGREEDVAHVRSLFARHRLVTVTAVGGSGKTRVALAVGEEELPHRSGGVWFADLRTTTNDGDVPAAIGNAVGLSLRDGDATAQVVDHLADKAAMVILDNCEHVVEGCASFANRFLTRAGESVLLATSREVLAVEGECTVLLGSLSAEGSDAPAVRLFAQRAAAADSRFVVDETNASIIGAVCQRLDGMPLAIELAAARVTMMTVSELADGLDDRFALLADVRHRQPERTLKGTLDWSYDLLGRGEQRVLRALGAFVDGFDVAGVAAVSDLPRTEAFRTVAALAAKSLVVRHDSGQQARFGLLETVMAYAEEQLGAAGETVDVRGAHLRHFHALATAQGHGGLAEIRLGVSLRPERRNLTAAFEWAAATAQWAQAGELITGSYPAYIFDGGALEARRLIERALAAIASHDASQADELRTALVMTAVWLTDWDSYRRAAEQLTRSATGITRALGYTALVVSTPFADRATGHPDLDRAKLELAAAGGTCPDWLGELIAGLISWVEGRAAASRGDFDEALRGCRAYLAQCDSLDYHPTTTPRTVKYAATCEILLGDPTSAIETVASLARFDASIFPTEDILGLALLARGELTDALPVVYAHAKRGLSGRMPGEVCDSAFLLAALAQAEGEDDHARDLLRQMGAGLEPGVILYSRHLAERLGIGAEHADRQRRALTYPSTSAQGLIGTRLATTAVRAELARRGWDERLPEHPS
jgi:predicted ATPase/class 3 adenylate cyclase